MKFKHGVGADFSSASPERPSLFWLARLSSFSVFLSDWSPRVPAVLYSRLWPQRGGARVSLAVTSSVDSPCHDGGGGAGRRSRFFSRFLPACGGLFGAGGGWGAAARRSAGAAAAADRLRWVVVKETGTRSRRTGPRAAVRRAGSPRGLSQ